MTDYTKSTNFASKDSLAAGNPLKIVKGTEIDTEFNNIATAVATKANSSDVTTSLAAKADLASPALTGTPTVPTATAGTNTTQAASTAFVSTAVSTAVATAVANVGYPAFKNRIINGAMTIDQRNAGASVTPTNGAYCPDRWRAELSQASKYSVQQVSDAPDGFVSSLKITSLSAYSVTSTDQFNIRQAIEGFNTSDLMYGTANAKTITVSFWVKSSLTGTFGASLTNANNTLIYNFNYTISAANTWEFKTVTIVGPTSGTWQTTNLAGIQVRFNLGLGATYGTTTTGSWVSVTDVVGNPSTTSVVGTNGATFYITGVQLEKGSTATSFDYRPYGTELALCQRYYETGRSAYGARNGGDIALGTVYFKSTKRTTPTNTFTTNQGGTATQQYSTVDSLAWYATPTSSLADVNFFSTAEL